MGDTTAEQTTPPPPLGLFTRWEEGTEPIGIVLCVSGIFGGVAGPCHGPRKYSNTRHGLYTGMARVLPARGWGVLQLEFEQVSHSHLLPSQHVDCSCFQVGPELFDACLQEVIAACDWATAQLTETTASRGHLLLAGHSFGGALVLCAAAARTASVSNVCTLASQTRGLPSQSQLEPLKKRRQRQRQLPPALVIHGSEDTVLNVSCAAAVARCLGGGVTGSSEAVTVMHIPKSGHKLNHAAEQVVGAVITWVLRHRPVVLPVPGKSRLVTKQAVPSAIAPSCRRKLVSCALPESPVLSPPARVRLRSRALDQRPAVVDTGPIDLDDPTEDTKEVTNLLITKEMKGVTTTAETTGSGEEVVEEGGSSGAKFRALPNSDHEADEGISASGVDEVTQCRITEEKETVPIMPKVSMMGAFVSVSPVGINHNCCA